MPPQGEAFQPSVRFSLTSVRLVERLHVDLCRLNGDLCR